MSHGPLNAIDGRGIAGPPLTERTVTEPTRQQQVGVQHRIVQHAEVQQAIVQQAQVQPLRGEHVKVERLRCEFGGRVTLELPHLVIRAGERVAIVGANGAGKSTLLRCLSGFLQPRTGHVVVLDRQVGASMSRRGLRELRTQVAQVLQGLHLVQRLTALENVAIGALGRLSGWRSWARCHSVADWAEAQTALNAVGMGHKANSRADRLSGGERQKVAIARMLMQRPRLILADEPTASLDPAAALEVCRLLRQSALGATLITVVHQPELLPLLCERVIGLRHGRLEFDLPLAALDSAALNALYRVNIEPLPDEVPASSDLRWNTTPLAAAPARTGSIP